MQCFWVTIMLLKDKNVKPISTYINTKISVCLSVCLLTFFSAISEPTGIPFGTKFLLGGTRSPSGTRGRSLGRRQGRSRGVSWRRSRSRSRSRGVGQRFKPIVELIDTIKLVRLHCAVAKREVIALGALKAHDAAELLFGALKV